VRFLLCLIFVFVWPTELLAGEKNFGQVAQEVREDLEKARGEKALNEADLALRQKDLVARRNRLKAEVKAEGLTLEADEKSLEALRERRVELEGRIHTQTGQMKEVDATIRDFAQNFTGLAERSPYSGEDPGRLKRLHAFLDEGGILGIQDIRTLVDLAFKDMMASRQILRRKGPIVDRQGREVEGEIIRLGNLSAIYREGGNTGYLTLSPASGRLLASAAPGWGVRRNLDQYFDGRTDSVYVDISGGVAVKQLSQRTGLWEEILSGGLLVWPILLAGLIAGVLIIERLIFLGKVRQNTDRLMTQVTELVDAGDYKGAMVLAERQPGQPTSNVLKAGLAQQGHARDILESSLAEAILRETPRLERFLPALKVLAAIAPLLGLLGTVTGMIKTFQVITVHGTGDPRLMAGGISEALVTTELGLAVAIPILVISALLGRKAQRIASDMEEKAMALIAALLRDRRTTHGLA